MHKSCVVICISRVLTIPWCLSLSCVTFLSARGPGARGVSSLPCPILPTYPWYLPFVVRRSFMASRRLLRPAQLYSPEGTIVLSFYFARASRKYMYPSLSLGVGFRDIPRYDRCFVFRFCRGRVFFAWSRFYFCCLLLRLVCIGMISMYLYIITYIDTVLYYCTWASMIGRMAYQVL